MRLDVGSGAIPAEGEWTTVDLYHPDAEVQADMRALPYPDETVEAINCSHALEHVSTLDGRKALAEFHRVLMPGGILTIEVPDLSAACRRWLDGFGDDKGWAYTAIYGGETGPGLPHLAGYDAHGLAWEILSAGFEVPRIEEVHSHGMACLRATAVRG